MAVSPPNSWLMCRRWEIWVDLPTTLVTMASRPSGLVIGSSPRSAHSRRRRNPGSAPRWPGNRRPAGDRTAARGSPPARAASPVSASIQAKTAFMPSSSRNNRWAGSTNSAWGRMWLSFEVGVAPVRGEDPRGPSIENRGTPPGPIRSPYVGRPAARLRASRRAPRGAELRAQGLGPHAEFARRPRLGVAQDGEAPVVEAGRHQLGVEVAVHVLGVQRDQSARAPCRARAPLARR